MSEKKNYFAFYETFEEQLSGLPEETQARFYLAIVKYGLHGKDTEFDNPLEAALFKQFKFAIDNQKAKSKTNSGNRKNEKKENETKKKETEGKKTNENEKKGNADEEEVEVEVEVEVEGEEENAAEAASAPSFSEPRQDYARQIFGIWNGAGLPCKNGNFITFLQTDFKQGISYAEGIHSDDVIQAARNFASTLKNPNVDPFWKKQQPTFEGFCRGNLLPQFLPDSFRAERYLKEKPDKAAAAERAAEREKERKERLAEKYKDAPKKCPDCGSEMDYSQGYGVCVKNCGFWCESEDGAWAERRKGGG